MPWKKALLFVGGMAATAAVQGIANLPAVRNVAVNGVAKCMDVSDGIQSATQNLMDDAADLRAEAKLQRQIDAAVAEKIAGIEDEIRAEIREKLEAADTEDEPAEEPEKKPASRSKK